MESPSSTVRRRAWIHSSRQRLTLEELDPQGPPCDFPSLADDDVFSDGCSAGKIESWLLGCGLEACSEISSHLSVEPVPKAINSFEDDLTLGADASALHFGEIRSAVGLPLLPPAEARHSRLTTSTPRQELCLPSLNLGHSMASSCPSSSISKTTSNVSEVLQLCSEDAEETLYQLGFGCDEPQVTARIPARFLTFPSQLEGINFRLFLESQLRRIREEDPSLSLASRFRQVEVLTAMANAFYSLYSHVSRTPLQKLAPPEFTLSPVEKIRRFRSSIRSEPRSPVERLKDTVSKMCLYTGSPRGSDSTSPQPSPRKRSSLPDVVGIVLENTKTGTSKKLDLGEYNGTCSTVDISPSRDSDKSCTDGLEEHRQQTAVDRGTLQHSNTVCLKEIQGIKQTDVVEADGSVVKPTDLNSRTHSLRTSVASSLSETDHQCPSCQPELDCGSRPADLIPVAKFTYDAICPQIAERDGSPRISSERESGPDRSRAGSHRCPTSGGQLANKGASRSLPHLAPNSRYTPYRTVTGWEGDDVSPYSSNTPDSFHSPATRPVQTREQSSSRGENRYLHPLKHQTLRHISNNPQQVNSFELEEVQSAGEEDFGQLETTRTTTTPTSTEHQCKGLVVRGDSMQSDSSGYADEEVSPSTDRHGR